MKGRTERRSCLGFQWEPACWEDAPLWFDTLFGRLQGRPVHWNLPAFSPDLPVRRRTALARPLSSRIESNGDMVTSMGFAGAFHPLLNLDELDKELGWGLRNPWATGVTDVFDARPNVMIPNLPDLRRPDAWKLYRAHGFSLVGVCRDAWDAAPAGSPSAGWLSVVRLRVASPPGGESAARRVRRLAASAADLYLLLDLSGLTVVGPLEEILDELTPARSPARAKLNLVEAPVTDTLKEDAPGGSADWTPFSVPLLRARLAATGALARKKRKKTEEIRDILTALGAREMPADSRADARKEPAHHLRLVAHMLGDVVLVGASFDVCLAGGRFCGLTRQGRDLVPRIPALSNLRVSGKDLTFRTVSSFSFEGESGTGLREELRLDGSEESGLSIEYFFRDDSPRLTISGEIRCPRIPVSARVDHYAPLVLALREVARGESVEVLAAAPDGSASTASVPEGSILVLPGATHRVRRVDGGWIVLCFSGPADGPWGIPSFRIRRHRGKRLLVVNPFGSWTPLPSATVSGRRETFSMLLGLEDA